MVKIENLTETNIDLSELIKLTTKILDEKNIKKEVSVFIVSNEKITELNRKFFKKNKPTNVISYNLDDDKKLLGEIIISVDYCEKEKTELGFTLVELMVFYFIHGLLHLLGFEHIYGGKEEKKMAKEERRLFKIIYPDIEFENET